MGDRITVTADELIAEIAADMGEPFDARLDVTPALLADKLGISEEAARDRLEQRVKAGRLRKRTAVVVRGERPRCVYRAA